MKIPGNLPVLKNVWIWRRVRRRILLGLFNHPLIISASKTPTVHMFHNYPYQQIKVRSQPDASITKTHCGKQHPRPVLPTKSEHPKPDRR